MLKKELVFPFIFLMFGCTSQTGYYLRNTNEYDQKIIISLGNFFEEQKRTKLELKYTYKLVKVGDKTFRRLKGDLKPKYLNSRQIEVVVPGKSTMFIDAQNPGFSNVIFRNSGQYDTLYYNQLRRWSKNGKSSESYFFDLE